MAGGSNSLCVTDEAEEGYARVRDEPAASGRSGERRRRRADRKRFMCASIRHPAPHCKPPRCHGCDAAAHGGVRSRPVFRPDARDRRRS
ncbi:hypothetical protein BURCENBC7_AP7769 [Burkholderia cenocepacia BC7]|nr:hypothetical protein BURCENK562V_C6220 [Burkholderia cenocepacia K56-2Valvano]ERI30482.1 hypothetical protein BURCENBC7_AP7769 [Burkholderia cenocepacia BC7]CDN61084.1 hypothetical protein I35_2561 [Burkholderia cenocepacia H111]